MRWAQPRPRPRGAGAGSALAIALALLALAVGAPPPAHAQTEPGIQVVREGAHAPYLADSLGRPLYLFTADRRGSGDRAPESRCTSECLAAWPPLTTTGAQRLQVGEGVDRSKVGTVERAAGATQITYAGWPLYLYAEDEPRRVRGQDVHEFGGGWYLLRPDGTKIEEESHAGGEASGGARE